MSKHHHHTHTHTHTHTQAWASNTSSVCDTRQNKPHRDVPRAAGDGETDTPNLLELAVRDTSKPILTSVGVAVWSNAEYLPHHATPKRQKNKT